MFKVVNVASLSCLSLHAYITVHTLCHHLHSSTLFVAYKAARLLNWSCMSDEIVLKPHRCCNWRPASDHLCNANPIFPHSSLCNGSAVCRCKRSQSFNFSHSFSFSIFCATIYVLATVHILMTFGFKIMAPRLLIHYHNVRQSKLMKEQTSKMKAGLNVDIFFYVTAVCKFKKIEDSLIYSTWI